LEGDFRAAVASTAKYGKIIRVDRSRRQFRPPSVPDTERARQSDPKVQKEIARRWRRLWLKSTLSNIGSLVVAIVILGLIIGLQWYFGVTICIFRL